MQKRSPRINPCLVFLNVLFGFAGLCFIAMGLWMVRHHSTNCVHFLQTFSVGTGLFMLLVALAGLLGSFARITWLLYLNFAVMLALLLAVLTTTVFVLVVTSHGIKAYVSETSTHKDPLLSHWLTDRVNHRMESCTRDGRICEFVKHTYYTSSTYYRPSLSSLQKGCCEPPAECNGINVTTMSMEADCEAWKEVGPQGFCSYCSSCHAAVAENVRHVWHQIAIFKVITLLILIPTYFLTCYSFKQEDNDHQSHDKSCHECLNCCYSCLP